MSLAQPLFSTLQDPTNSNIPKSYKNNPDRLSLLQSGLKNNSTAPALLLDEINVLRKAKNQEELDLCLNELLSVIDYSPGTTTTSINTKSLPRWTKIKSLSRFSKRARLASFIRVLDMSTPLIEVDENVKVAEDNADAKDQRRKRAFLLLLRSLAEQEKKKIHNIFSTPAILKIEKLALRDIKSASNYADIETRVPQGLETPKYEVLKRSKGNCEIRRYSNFAVCTVDMNQVRPANSTATTDAKLSNPQLPGASSFGALAGYIFGKNDRSESMKMTTPVFTKLDNNNDNSDEEKSRKMSFVMPSSYWGEEQIQNAPKPLMNSGVTLSTQEGGTRAVLMFGGFASRNVVKEREQKLLDSLRNDKEWTMPNANDVITLAQYNDPFTPPWKRRNEVSVSVVSCKTT